MEGSITNPADELKVPPPEKSGTVSGKIFDASEQTGDKYENPVTGTIKGVNSTFNKTGSPSQEAFVSMI